MSVSKIPPPPPLRLGGLVDDDPSPTPKVPATPRSRGAVQGERARATIVLPASLAAQLREGARETGRTQADLVLSALLAHYQSVADQVNAAATDRASVGLPPLRPPRPKGPTVQLSVAMTTLGKTRLDGDAEQLGMGRSALVTAVLATEFAGPAARDR